MANLQTLFISSAQRIEVLEDLIGQLEEGDSIREIVDDLNKYGSGFEKLLGAKLRDTMEIGGGLSRGFEGLFPEIAIQCISAGEEAGDLVEGCRNAIQSLKGTSGVGHLFFKTLTFPVIGFSASVFFIIYMGNALSESFTGMIPLNHWPTIARAFLDYTGYWVDSWFSFTVKTVALITLFLFALRNWAGKARTKVDNFPIISVYKTITASQILNTLAIMLDTGRSMNDSLQFCAKAGSRYQRWKVLAALEKLTVTSTNAGNAGDILDIGLMSTRQISRLKKRGDRAQNLPDLLRRQASQAHENAKKRINQFLITCKFLILVMALLNVVFSLVSILSLSIQIAR